MVQLWIALAMEAAYSGHMARAARPMNRRDFAALAKIDLPLFLDTML